MNSSGAHDRIAVSVCTESTGRSRGVGGIVKKKKCEREFVLKRRKFEQKKGKEGKEEFSRCIELQRINYIRLPIRDDRTSLRRVK
jgi:hypothetical protein